MLNWKRRMGVHYAFHRNSINRYLHWFLIPFQLIGVLLLFSAIPFPAYLPDFVSSWISIPPFVLCVATGYIYCQTVKTIGISFVLFLICLHSLSFHLLNILGLDSTLYKIFIGLALFICANLLQTRIGHSFEFQCRDDTKKNIREFKETKDIVPLLLIFYYHFVEIWLIFGYDNELKKEIEVYRDEYVYED